MRDEANEKPGLRLFVGVQHYRDLPLPLWIAIGLRTFPSGPCFRSRNKSICRPSVSHISRDLFAGGGRASVQAATVWFKRTAIYGQS